MFFKTQHKNYGLTAPRASLIIGHSRLTAEFTRIRKERSEKEIGHAPLLHQY